MGDTFRDMEHEERRGKKEDKIFSFFLHGIAIAQGRPRFRRTGTFVQTYDPKKSKDWKEMVGWQGKEIKKKNGWAMIEGPIEASIKFMLQRPKSLPKRIEYHVKKPDCENLSKAIFDALEGIMYKNDSQIWKLSIEKHYETALPGVSVVLRECE